MSPRQGPRRPPVSFRPSAEQRHQLDVLAAEDGITLTAVLLRAVDRELKAAAKRRAKATT